MTAVGISAVTKREVGLGHVAWDSPIRGLLPWFTLSDPEATRLVTIGDMYAHRSGLPEHMGDRLEDMGFDQRQVLERLRYVPLDRFRKHYDYTNFGVTAGGLATSAAAGIATKFPGTLAEFTPRSSPSIGRRRPA